MVSKEIAKILNINLNRWKQLTREYLRPDPLAGQQCGRARDFSAEEIVLVYYAEQLLRAKFPVKIVGSIICDLEQYFKNRGFFPMNRWCKKYPMGKSLPSYSIVIVVHRTDAPSGFFLLERKEKEEMSDDRCAGDPVWVKKYVPKPISTHELGSVLYSVEFSFTVDFKTFFCPMFVK